PLSPPSSPGNPLRDEPADPAEGDPPLRGRATGGGGRDERDRRVEPRRAAGRRRDRVARRTGGGGGSRRRPRPRSARQRCPWRGGRLQGARARGARRLDRPPLHVRARARGRGGRTAGDPELRGGLRSDDGSRRLPLGRGDRVGGAYSTVTVFARFRGWSTFNPRRRPIR